MPILLALVGIALGYTECDRSAGSAGSYLLEDSGARLRKRGEEEIVTIRVLAQKGIPQAKVARQPDVSEGTVRYHVRRAGHFSFDWAHPAAGCRVCGRCGYTHRLLANR